MRMFVYTYGIPVAIACCCYSAWKAMHLDYADAFNVACVAIAVLWCIVLAPPNDDDWDDYIFA